MSVKGILYGVGALACAAIGFVAAQQLDRARYEKSSEEARIAAEARLNTALGAQGEAVLRAFVAGVAPAVAAKRRETMELAALSMLRIQGVAGVHLLGVKGDVLYSSDAKLTTAGDAEYRGGWALQATELISRQSPRAGVVDIAMPIGAGEEAVVAWLEYDAAALANAGR